MEKFAWRTGSLFKVATAFVNKEMTIPDRRPCFIRFAVIRSPPPIGLNIDIFEIKNILIWAVPFGQTSEKA